MCDSVVAVGAETAAGATLFAKNSDRKGGECQPLLQFAEASHPPEARVRCTHVEIPQVAETYRVVGHSPWWVWGFEHGVNEYAVAIGNHSIFSKEPIEETAGLIGMDLVRLGLERGRSAREALEVIAGLIESHGQGGAAFAPDAGGYHNSFTLADPQEAWLLETSNRRWAARRTRLDGVSNHYSIGPDWEIGSRDIAAFARVEGWWPAGGRIDVAAAYRNPNVPPRVSEGRQRRSRELLNRASGRHDVSTFQQLLRDHLDGGPVWQPGASADDECYFTLCAHSEPISWTTASIVAPLPADPKAPWPVWVSFGTPCTGVFLPIYLNGAIPAELARGGEHPEPDSAWWTFKHLQDAASADPVNYTPMLREAWVEFEDRLEKERLVAEAAARAESEAGDSDRAAQLVTEFMERVTGEALQRAVSLRAEIG